MFATTSRRGAGRESRSGEYLATRLGLQGDGALQADAPDQPRLFVQFAVARAVRRHLAVAGPPDVGQVRPVSGADAGSARQLFVSSLTDETGRVLVLAMSVDEHVVRTRIWAEVARPGDATGPVPSLVPVRDGTPFRTAFRYWTIEWPPDPARQAGWATDVVVFGGTTVGVLGVLVLGVMLLVRDVGRDAATARLQADLVNGVSHDLKTPLSVIRLYAESLADDLAEVDEARASHSRVILHESERLDHLVERVLAFSRHETGPPDYRRDRLDPSALVRGVVARYGAYLSHLGFMATVDCAPGTPDVEGDSAALTQALVNLVDNAVKYSGDARVLVLRVRPRHAEVVIEVEDRGIGIPQDEQGRVFEPFRRGSRAVGRGGYGLGLHLVWRILEAHGGGVEVESPLEGGTCVRLVLPAAGAVEE